MAFAVYLPLGPDTGEIARAIDTIESAVFYAGSLKWVVVVDDSLVPRTFHGQINLPSHCELVILPNPRLGVGHGDCAGLCVADIVAFAYIQERTSASFALKLDSDSLVVGPFEEQIETTLSRFTDAGLIGVVGDSFGENRTYRMAEWNAAMCAKALKVSENFASLSNEDRAFLHGFDVNTSEQFECFLKALSILKRARDRSYPLGQYCQGGGYAVSRAMLDSIAGAGFLSDPLMWTHVNIGEDVMMGILCGAIGMRMYDFSGEGKPFAIHPRCLPLSRNQIIAMNCSIIHSVKGSKEKEFREFFRQRRTRCHPTSCVF